MDPYTSSDYHRTLSRFSLPTRHRLSWHPVNHLYINNLCLLLMFHFPFCNAVEVDALHRSHRPHPRNTGPVFMPALFSVLTEAIAEMRYDSRKTVTYQHTTFIWGFWRLKSKPWHGKCLLSCAASSPFPNMPVG